MKTKNLTITIANSTVRLFVNDRYFDQARRCFKRYLCDLEPEYTVWVTIAHKVSISPTIEQGIRVKGNILMSAADEFFGMVDLNTGIGNVTICETWAMGVLSNFVKNLISYIVFSKGGLMLHASGLVRDGEAYIYFGPSGIGKSTVAKVSTDCRILSDELIAVVPHEGMYRAFGTPSWSEGIDEHRKACNNSYPVRGLFK